MRQIVDLDSNRTVSASGSSLSTHQIPDGRSTVLASVTVPTVTGTTPSLTPILMHSIDGASFSVLATGSAITTSGGISIFGPATTAVVGQFLRMDYTVSGTAPVFTGLNAKVQLL